MAGIKIHNKNQDVQDAITTESKALKFPTQVVNLPSKGLLYPPDNPLSNGTVEIKYMTAKEEDILTTESYIRAGIVIDKLLQSLIVGPNFDYNSLLIGDKNAIMIAARIYGYGEKYEITVNTPAGHKQTVDINLMEIPNKELDESVVNANGKNEFTFTTPRSNDVLTFKLLTVGDQKEIDAKLKKSKSAGNRDPQLTVMLGQLITAVNGDNNPLAIKHYVENMLVQDSKAFREYVAEIQPNVNLEIELVDEVTMEPFRSDITFDTRFFWPDSRL